MMQHQQTKLAEEEERTMIGLLMHYTENQSPPHPLRYEYDKGSEILRGQRGLCVLACLSTPLIALRKIIQPT